MYNVHLFQSGGKIVNILKPERTKFSLRRTLANTFSWKKKQVFSLSSIFHWFFSHVTATANLYEDQSPTGPWFNKKYHLTSIGNPMEEIRRSYDRLISTMGFPILVRCHLYIESGPWFHLRVSDLASNELQRLDSTLCPVECVRLLIHSQTSMVHHWGLAMDK